MLNCVLSCSLRRVIVAHGPLVKLTDYGNHSNITDFSYV